MPAIQIKIGKTTRLVQGQPGVSLLDEVLACGLNVSYSCKRGDCGQCVGALRSGEFESIDPSKPSVSGEKIFLCNSCARTDAQIELPYYPELKDISLRRSPCKINDLKQVSDDVLIVSLRLPPGSELKFLPGQHIRLTNREKITRSYSLAEPPRDNKHLYVHVKRVKDGAFSRYLFDGARPGDLLHLEGPLGHFFLREHIVVSKTIFLATGTGIAPIYAILSALTPPQRQNCGELFLCWGNRFRTDAYFKEQLEFLAKRNGMQVTLAFSRAGNVASSLHAGYVQYVMTSHHPDLKSAQIFACGNAGMIEDVRRLGTATGLPAERFYADPFTVS